MSQGNPTPYRKPLIIGVGNPNRQDDAIGLHLLKEMQKRFGEDVDTLENIANPLILADQWVGRDLVFVLDACSPEVQRQAGDFIFWDCTHERLPDESVRSSTHSMGLGDVIELSRALGRLPKKLIVVGVVGKSFAMGNEIEEATARRMEPNINLIFDKMRREMHA